MESGEDSEGSDSEKVVNVAVRVPSDAAHVYLQINLHALCTSGECCKWDVNAV